MSFSVSAELTR